MTVSNSGNGKKYASLLAGDVVYWPSKWAKRTQTMERGRTDMSKTASMVMKIIGASLALAAVICLLIGGWHDLSVGCCGMKKRLSKRFRSEYDDYADEELFS